MKTLLLTRDQELSLARRVHAGDRAAERELAEGNLRLVYKLASRYAWGRPHLEVADLIQEGTVGLMIAVRRYDPERPVKFATYATWWVRQAIVRFIMKYRARPRETPLPSQNDSPHILDQRDSGGSLDAFVDPRSTSEVASVTDIPGFVQLPKRYKQIISSRFGLNGQQALSRRELAAQLGLSISRVWQLENRALTRLRAAGNTLSSRPTT